MRFERILLPVLLALPVALALVGWPLLFKWLVGPAHEPTPAAGEAPATLVAQVEASRPKSPGTEILPPTLMPQPVATSDVLSSQTQTGPFLARSDNTAPTPSVAPVRADDPATTVASFYTLIAQHDYGAAAQLWSPHMQSAFPPAENINQRFGQTQTLALERAEVISQDPVKGTAAVGVDVLESTQAGARRWVGTWYLIRGPSGWLLDQPQLQSDWATNVR